MVVDVRPGSEANDADVGVGHVLVAVDDVELDEGSLSVSAVNQRLRAGCVRACACVRAMLLPPISVYGLTIPLAQMHVRVCVVIVFFWFCLFTLRVRQASATQRLFCVSGRW